MRIYLDMCCFNRPYDDQSQMCVALEAQAKLHIQNRIQEGIYDLIGSYILDYEVSRNPFDMRKNSITSFIQRNMKGYVGPERDGSVSFIASDIMKTGVKEKDALHVASAIYAKCTYFISTDKRLLKYRSDQIRLVSPIDFIMETEDEQ